MTLLMRMPMTARLQTSGQVCATNRVAGWVTVELDAMRFHTGTHQQYECDKLV